MTLLKSLHNFKSYPKINLNLEVMPKEANELLHKIKSVVIPFYGLYDEVKITKAKSYKLKSNIIIKDNIISKVVEYFKREYNISFNYQIKLKKNIPLGSGLGGASSNAWIIINFINQEFNLNLTIEELRSIAMLFGSDIPLFSYNQPLLVEEYGNKLTLINIKDLKNILLITIPKLSINTKEMYSLFDSETNKIIDTYNYSFEIEQITKRGNSFFSIILKNNHFAKIYNELTKINTPFLTGSGPSLFMVNINHNIIKKVLKIKGLKTYFYEF